jgi:ABC-type amino acid transport substrate-binding protein
MHATNLYLLMGKHVPSETVKRVQAALTQLEKSGELVRLLKKWQEE